MLPKRRLLRGFLQVAVELLEASDVPCEAPDLLLGPLELGRGVLGVAGSSSARTELVPEVPDHCFLLTLGSLVFPLDSTSVLFSAFHLPDWASSEWYRYRGMRAGG